MITRGGGSSEFVPLKSLNKHIVILNEKVLSCNYSQAIVRYLYHAHPSTKRHGG